MHFCCKTKLKQAEIWEQFKFGGGDWVAKKACGINDEVECLKHSFAVIHLWQKMWAIILGVRSKPLRWVCMHLMWAECLCWWLLPCIGTNPLPKPRCSGGIGNKRNSPMLFVFYLNPRHRDFTVLVGGGGLQFFVWFIGGFLIVLFVCLLQGLVGFLGFNFALWTCERFGGHVLNIFCYIFLKNKNKLFALFSIKISNTLHLLFWELCFLVF